LDRTAISRFQDADSVYYNPIDKAIELNPPPVYISTWAAHFKAYLVRLESENSRLHSSVHDPKGRVVKVEFENQSRPAGQVTRNQENISLQILLDGTTSLPTEISDIKTLQKEIRTQQALFQLEAELRSRLLRGRIQLPHSLSLR
jgi:hypothetical protein